MKTPFEMYIPCERFEVTLHVSPHKGLSPIERLVLEAIFCGKTQFQDLKELFQLGERPMLDLLLDLWRQDYLLIDPESGQITLTEALRQKVAVGDFEQLQGGSLAERTLELYLERVGGHILPALPWNEGLRNGRQVPPLTADYAWQTASREELLLAVKRRFAQLQEHEASLHLVDFSLPPATGNTLLTSKPRFLRVEARCTRDALERLQLDIVGPSEVPAALRKDLSRALTRLAWQQPQRPVFKAALDEAQDHSDPAQFSSQRALERLRDEAMKLEKASVLSAPALHERLEERGEIARYLVRERLSQQGTPRCREAEEHLRWIDEALNRAQRQVILAFPTLRYEGIAKLLPAFRQALERGVQVAILWGTRREEQLDAKVLQAFEDLSRSHRGFDWSPLSSRLNARFVSLDDEELLLTVCEPLAREREKSLALGLHFVRQNASDSPLDTGSSSACQQLQEACRRIVPDYRIGQRLRTEATGTSSAVAAQLATDPLLEEAGEGVPPRLQLPRLPIALQPPRAEDGTREEPARQPSWDPEFQQAQLTLWKASWRAFVQELEQVRESIGPGASLLEDGEHVTRLWLRLNEAKQFLLMASPRITRAAFSPNLRKKLEERLKEGLCVVVLHQKPAETGLEAVMRELARRNKSFQVIKHDHALNLLLDESEVTLTSFPLLSFDELHFESGWAKKELGLTVRDPDFAGQLLDRLHKDIPELKLNPNILRAKIHPVSTSRSPEKGRPDAAPRPTPRLQSLLDMVGRSREREDTDLPTQLENWAQQYGADPALWQDLRTLMQLNVPMLLRQKAAAAALQLRWKDRGTSGAQEALRWLVTRLWFEEASHDMIELSLLASQLDGPAKPSMGQASENTSLPSAPVMELLAYYSLLRKPSNVTIPRDNSVPIDDKELGESIELLWDDVQEASPQLTKQDDCVTALAWYAVLVHQCPYAWGWLTYQQVEKTSGLQSISCAVRDVYRRYQEAPRELLQYTEEQLDEAESTVKESLKSAQECAISLEHLSFDYKHGQALWRHLLSHPSFHPILSACKAGDGSKLRMEIDRWKSAKLTPSGLLEIAVKDFSQQALRREAQLVLEKRASAFELIQAFIATCQDYLSAADRHDVLSAQLQALAYRRESSRKIQDAVNSIKSLHKQWSNTHPASPILKRLLTELHPESLLIPAAISWSKS